MELKNLKKGKARLRRLKDIARVLYDQQWYQQANQEKILYWMWRGLEKPPGLSYDILQFSDSSLGQELLKTAGHGHSLVPETDLTYPELYQVLEGEVIYLLQKKKEGRITRVLAIPCRKNDFCLVPPNFEHVTINLAGNKTFMANWVAQANVSDYSPIEEKGGAAYFGLSGQPINWVKNDRYGQVPAIEFKKPTDFNALGIDIKENMYYNKENTNVLNFLQEPQKHSALWANLFS